MKAVVENDRFSDSKPDPKAPYQRRRISSIQETENEALLMRKVATESEFRTQFDKDYAGEGTYKHETFKEELSYWCGALCARSARALRGPWDWRARLPGLRLLCGGYRRGDLAADATAGLAEGIMAVPQGLSYAMLAEVPPIYGLYVGLVHPVVYALTGSSRELSMGVSAIENLLVAEAVASVLGAGAAAADPAAAARVAVALSLATAAVHAAMGLLRLGALSALLADPVLSGFSTASAFLIGTSQLKHLLGVEGAKSPYTPVVWADLLLKLPNLNVASLAIGLAGMAFLALMKKVNARYFKRVPLPAPLFLVVLATLAVWLGRLHEAPYRVAILGHVPSGPPAPGLPSFQDAGFTELLQPALTLGVITYIMSLSIAKTVANQNDYQVAADQELLAIGACNLVGGFFGCYPVAASLSRTAVISAAGARTQAHSLVAAAVMLLVLVAITPALYYLPKACLASVVLHGVVKMVDFAEARRFLTTHRPDFLLWVVAFAVTFTLGAIYGIVASVAVSLIWLLKKISLPSTAVLGRLPGTVVYRNVKRFPIAQAYPGIEIFRFDAPLHFANKDFFEAKVKALAQKDGTHTIIIDASSINDLDSSAVRMLMALARRLETASVDLLFANWKGPQRDFLDDSGFHALVPTTRLFLSLHDAVLSARAAHHPHRAHQAALRPSDARDAAEESRDPEETPPLGPTPVPGHRKRPSPAPLVGGGGGDPGGLAALPPSVAAEEVTPKGGTKQWTLAGVGMAGGAAEDRAAAAAARGGNQQQQGRGASPRAAVWGGQGEGAGERPPLGAVTGTGGGATATPPPPLPTSPSASSASSIKKRHGGSGGEVGNGGSQEEKKARDKDWR